MCLESPKLISRKIWVIEKSWNFHIVRKKKTSVKLTEKWMFLRRRQSWQHWFHYYLPYKAARSSAVSSRQFLMLGSAPCFKSSLTASKWPYCAAEWMAVSLSAFWNRKLLWVAMTKKLREIDFPLKNRNTSWFHEILFRVMRVMFFFQTKMTEIN